MRLLQADYSDGFTLLEILLVIILIGIFVVLALVQHSTSDASLNAQVQVLKSHLRYAQMRSFNSETSWGIYFHHNSAAPDNSHYLLFKENNINNIEQLPGETQDRVHLGHMGITVSSAISPATPVAQSFQIAFDDWGIPRSIELDPSGPGSYLLSLTKSGRGNAQFVITQNTGFMD